MDKIHIRRKALPGEYYVIGGKFNGTTLHWHPRRRAYPGQDVVNYTEVEWETMVNGCADYVSQTSPIEPLDDETFEALLKFIQAEYELQCRKHKRLLERHPGYVDDYEWPDVKSPKGVCYYDLDSEGELIGWRLIPESEIV